MQGLISFRRGLLIVGILLGGLILFFGSSGKKRDDKEAARVVKDKAYGSLTVVADRDAQLLPAFVERNELSPHHTARIKLVWPQEVFGTSSSEQQRALEVQAKALAGRECEALMRTFASRCETSGTRVDLWDKSAILVINLNFASKDDFGTAPHANEKLLSKFNLRYEGDSSIPPQVRSISAGASRRESIYQQIRQECRDVKAAYGNCLLYRVDIDAWLIGGEKKHDISISGSASLATLRSGDVQVPLDWR